MSSIVIIRKIFRFPKGFSAYRPGPTSPRVGRWECERCSARYKTPKGHAVIKDWLDASGDVPHVPYDIDNCCAHIPEASNASG